MLSNFKRKVSSSPKLKGWLIAVFIFVFPFLAWPLTYLISAVGCTGNEGTGVVCQEFIGLDLSVLAEIIFFTAAWGFIFCFPVSLLVFVICSFLPWKKKTV